MTRVLLLQGPDDKRYTATSVQGGSWKVKRFSTSLHFESQWWSERLPFRHWDGNVYYSPQELDLTFKTLAETKSYEEEGQVGDFWICYD